MNMVTTYLEPAAVIAEIQSNVATIRGKPADDKLALYAKYFVAEVLDYCNRDDFPQALCMTGADVVGRWLDDMENGGRRALTCLARKMKKTRRVRKYLALRALFCLTLYRIYGIT
jgi:hypothetical protein